MAREFSLSVEKLQALRQAFRALDLDKSGFIDCTELQALVRFLGWKVSDEKVRDLLRRYDTDASDDVDFREFVAMFVSIRDFMTLTPDDAVAILRRPCEERSAEDVHRLSLFLAQNVPYFGSFSHDAVDFLAARATHRACRDVDVLTRQGQPADEMFVVLDGVAAAFAEPLESDNPVASPARNKAGDARAAAAAGAKRADEAAADRRRRQEAAVKDLSRAVVASRLAGADGVLLEALTRSSEASPPSPGDGVWRHASAVVRQGALLSELATAGTGAASSHLVPQSRMDDASALLMRHYLSGSMQPRQPRVQGARHSASPPRRGRPERTTRHQLKRPNSAPPHEGRGDARPTAPLPVPHRLLALTKFPELAQPPLTRAPAVVRPDAAVPASGAAGLLEAMAAAAEEQQRLQQRMQPGGGAVDGGWENLHIPALSAQASPAASGSQPSPAASPAGGRPGCASLAVRVDLSQHFDRLTLEMATPRRPGPGSPGTHGSGSLAAPSPSEGAILRGGSLITGQLPRTLTIPPVASPAGSSPTPRSPAPPSPQSKLWKAVKRSVDLKALRVPSLGRQGSSTAAREGALGAVHPSEAMRMAQQPSLLGAVAEPDAFDSITNPWLDMGSRASLLRKAPQEVCHALQQQGELQSGSLFAQATSHLSTPAAAAAAADEAVAGIDTERAIQLMPCLHYVTAEFLEEYGDLVGVLRAGDVIGENAAIGKAGKCASSVVCGSEMSLVCLKRSDVQALQQQFAGKVIFQPSFIAGIVARPTERRSDPELSKLTSVLTVIAALRRLNPEVVRSIAREVELQTHEAGSVLMRQGDHGEHMCVMVSGEAYVFMWTADELIKKMAQPSWSGAAQEGYDDDEDAGRAPNGALFASQRRTSARSECEPHLGASLRPAPMKRAEPYVPHPSLFEPDDADQSAGEQAAPKAASRAPRRISLVKSNRVSFLVDPSAAQPVTRRHVTLSCCSPTGRRVKRLSGDGMLHTHSRGSSREGAAREAASSEMASAAASESDTIVALPPASVMLGLELTDEGREDSPSVGGEQPQTPGDGTLRGKRKAALSSTGRRLRMASQHSRPGSGVQRISSVVALAAAARTATHGRGAAAGEHDEQSRGFIDMHRVSGDRPEASRPTSFCGGASRSAHGSLHRVDSEGGESMHSTVSEWKRRRAMDAQGFVPSPALLTAVAMLRVLLGLQNAPTADGALQAASELQAADVNDLQERFGPVVRSVGVGTTLGEVALMKLASGSKRTATVVAAQQIQALVIRKSLYDRCIKAHQEAEIAEVMRLLLGLDCCRRLSEKERKLVAYVMTPAVAPPGAILFRGDDYFQGLLLIKGGAVRLFRGGPPGLKGGLADGVATGGVAGPIRGAVEHMTQLAVLGPGQLCGEDALALGGKHALTAVADSACELYQLKPQDVAMLGRRGIRDLMASWTAIKARWGARDPLPWQRCAMDAQATLRATADHLKSLLDSGVYAPARLMKSQQVVVAADVAAERKRVAAALQRALFSPATVESALQSLDASVVAAAWRAVEFQLPVPPTLVRLQDALARSAAPGSPAKASPTPELQGLAGSAQGVAIAPPPAPHSSTRLCTPPSTAGVPAVPPTSAFRAFPGAAPAESRTAGCGATRDDRGLQRRLRASALEITAGVDLCSWRASMDTAGASRRAETRARSPASKRADSPSPQPPASNSSLVNGGRRSASEVAEGRRTPRSGRDPRCGGASVRTRTTDAQCSGARLRNPAPAGSSSADLTSWVWRQDAPQTDMDPTTAVMTRVAYLKAAAAGPAHLAVVPLRPLTPRGGCVREELASSQTTRASSEIDRWLATAGGARRILAGRAACSYDELDLPLNAHANARLDHVWGGVHGALPGKRHRSVRARPVPTAADVAWVEDRLSLLSLAGRAPPGHTCSRHTTRARPDVAPVLHLAEAAARGVCWLS